MADATIEATRPLVTPADFEAQLMQRCRDEMARITARAEWLACVAECAARGEE